MLGVITEDSNPNNTEENNQRVIMFNSLFFYEQNFYIQIKSQE
ncbi:hypothetical protein cce_4668 [Crocosphaera subtropica ATCC 51142]|uniref:Uncharacterized protein n=1 Tax=Crocosphaera subtropica (strain ATCC 51142 / BH68) TaxID=43989 RepID=B1WW88_CROS5|nr:hypothetical protein cce_4668 [Crocosphaera subtropica ATCC 51142]